MEKTPVFLVAGFLGAGKTSTLRHALATLPGTSAILVNDFGEAAIDAGMLSAEGPGIPGVLRVLNVAGGCVCCTAPEGLLPALESMLENLRPDRIFIEPSGLARPQDLLDMVGRSSLRGRLAFGPVVVVLDGRRPIQHPLLEEQLEAADVVAINWADQCEPAALAALEAELTARSPAPLRVTVTQHGALPAEAWSWPEDAGLRLRVVKQEKAPSTQGFEARSAVLPADRRLAFDRVKVLLADPGIVRFKGHLSTDAGWMMLEKAGGSLQSRATAWRRDSRWDLIAEASVEIDRIQALLIAALAETEGGVGLSRVDQDGQSEHLTRSDFEAMPGQIPDVSLLFPGRVGRAVPLSAVLGTPPEGARFLMVARDGMVSEPAPPEAAGEAVLVYALGDAELPVKQGGPLRVLSAGRSCANIKDLIRIRWV